MSKTHPDELVTSAARIRFGVKPTCGSGSFLLMSRKLMASSLRKDPRHDRNLNQGVARREAAVPEY